MEVIRIRHFVQKTRDFQKKQQYGTFLLYTVRTCQNKFRFRNSVTSLICQRFSQTFEENTSDPVAAKLTDIAGSFCAFPENLCTIF